MTDAVHTADKADSARRYDGNGWFEIERNPLSKVGVFDYLGSSLGLEGEDADKMFKVYRPAEELGHPDCIASFRLQPWIDDHTFLGNGEDGTTPADQVGVHGVIGEKVGFDPDWDDGTLFGNLKCFSDSHAETVDGEGKRELSLGYLSRYDWTPGTFKGQNYDAVQRDIRGNHIASVDEGRMGSSVAVMDGKIHITCDNKDFKPMSKKTNTRKAFKVGSVTMDAAAFKRATAAVKKLQTGDADEIAEAVETIKKLAPLQEVLAGMAEGEAVEAVEVGGDEEAPGLAHERERVGERRADEKKGDKMTPDSEEETGDEDEAEETGDEDDAEETGDEDDADKGKKTGDRKASRKTGDNKARKAAPTMDMAAVVAHIGRRDALVARANKTITIDAADMASKTEAGVARHIGKAMGLQLPTSDAAAIMTVAAALTVAEGMAKKTHRVGDSAAKPAGNDPFKAAQAGN